MLVWIIFIEKGRKLGINYTFSCYEKEIEMFKLQVCSLNSLILSKN